MNVDVLVIGGGPAGLAAAIELRRAGVGRVLVAERETAFGGIARHSAHSGYGLRDFHRVMTGPRYAARYTELAARAGVELLASTTVVDVSLSPLTGGGGGGIRATLDASGAITTVAASAVLIATGTRERPRAARLIAGDRPGGIHTTGALQQLVLADRFAGRRAVVLGAEHVSFSAVLTLRHAGCDTVAVITPERRHQTFAALRWGTAGVRRVPVLTETQVLEIVGGRRVTGVVVRRANGVTETIACDSVIVSGDWVPDHELVRRSGFSIDRGSLAPPVDASMRLDAPGWFAAGNLLHGAETADVCALDGRHAARGILVWLADPVATAWPGPGVEVRSGPPFAWTFPNRLRPGDPPPRGRLLLRVSASGAAAPYGPGGNPPVTEPRPPGSDPDPPPNPHVTQPRANRHVEFPGSGRSDTAPVANRHVEIRPRPGRGRHSTEIHTVEVRQGDRELWEGRLHGATGPNRTAWIPTGWIDEIRPPSGGITELT